MKKKLYHIFTLLLIVVLTSSCDKFLDITPVGQVIPKTTSEYRALINTAYLNAFPKHKQMMNMRGNQFQPEPDPFGLGLDGFNMLKDIYSWNDLNPDPLTMEYPYQMFYQVVFFANEIIQNGANATVDSNEEMNQIIAEAYALRAYAYFELVNMYAPAYDKTTAATDKAVPLTTEIDIEQEFPRSTLQEVYNQIESDLAEASKLMMVDKQEPQNRYRFSKESLMALASRVYLYSNQWDKALAEAKKALAISTALEDMNSEEYTANTDYRSVESMLALEQVIDNDYLSNYTSIPQAFVAKFAYGDLRADGRYFITDINYVFDDDFNVIDMTEVTKLNKAMGSNNKVSFRRSEVYLNAAEAAAHLGKKEEALTYLFELMQRRYNPDTFASEKEKVSALNNDALIEAILAERERELAFEGHQWFDFKRTTQPEIVRYIYGEKVVLPAGDARYVLQFPRSAREVNPYLND